MSFNRLSYDDKEYKSSVTQSTGIAKYTLGTPINGCNKPCHIDNPRIRIDKKGFGNHVLPTNIDTQSALMGLNSMVTCDMPLINTPLESEAQEPCHFITPDDTRISNPACTLRGTGYERWDFPCREIPIEHPFEVNVDNRLMIKDTFKPTIDLPIQQGSWPNAEPIKNVDYKLCNIPKIDS